MSNLLPTLRQWSRNIAPGGAWYYGGYAGPSYLYFGYDRSYSYDFVGFRPEELMALVRDAEDAPRLRARVAELAEALGCHAEDAVKQAQALRAAADRLARAVFDFSHCEMCNGVLDGDDQECLQCMGDIAGPCSCTCGMCAMWRDARIVRPQGVRDPQPVPRAGQ